MITAKTLTTSQIQKLRCELIDRIELGNDSQSDRLMLAQCDRALLAARTSSKRIARARVRIAAFLNEHAKGP